MAYKLNKLQRKWINLLKTTKRKQTTGNLRDSSGYCCLGIACVALGIRSERDPYGGYSYGRATTTLPERAVKALKLRSEEGTSLHSFRVIGTGFPAQNHLTGLNDHLRLSFKEIAAILERHPEEFFI